MENLKELTREIEARIWKYFDQKTLRKSFRTGYAKEAFGKYYPKEAEVYSIKLEAYTWAGDDIADDTKAPHEEIKLNLFLAHIAAREMLFWPEWTRKIAYKHFNTMMEIAAIQDITNSKLKNADNEKEAIEIALKSYEGRATDIDFAIEIPSYFLNFSETEKSTAIDAGEAFRSINLFHKDIKDVPYDLHHNTETPVVIFIHRNFDIDKLGERIYEKALEKIKELKENVENEVVYELVTNFEEMIERERRIS